MALVQRPLTAVLAQPAVRTPRGLEGRRVGLAGRPDDAAVLRSIVTGAGGDPRRVRTARLGRDAVPGLLAGRVAGATAAWNAEGVAARARRPALREFRVDAYGAPAFPQLVLAVAQTTLRDHADLVRATVDALSRGYGEVLIDPETGVRDLQGAVAGLDRARLLGELDAVLPAFTAGARRFGELRPAALEAWSRWERRFGITKRRPNVARAFDGRFVPEGLRD
jgi:NitT/TauT family transport system substrate-binding protein/putative hydroxymethylpyrimidine transport system substrate-binding protein